MFDDVVCVCVCACFVYYAWMVATVFYVLLFMMLKYVLMMSSVFDVCCLHDCCRDRGMILERPLKDIGGVFEGSGRILDWSDI